MNPEKSLASTPSEELPWRAFLYVSEEMTAEETQEFEERLLTDQAAREAVAHAMKMSEGLWMATAMDSLDLQPTTTPSPSMDAPATSASHRKRTYSMTWLVSTIVLASLAFCVGWWFAQHLSVSDWVPSQGLAQTNSDQPSDAESTLDTDVEGAEQLLVIWTDSEALLSELEAGPAAEYSASEMSSREDSESEEDEFSWMLAAVSESSTTIPPTEPAVMEN